MKLVSFFIALLIGFAGTAVAAPTADQPAAAKQAEEVGAQMYAYDQAA